MTGHRPFSDLSKDFTPERRERVAGVVAALREDASLKAQSPTTVASPDVSDQNSRS
jgi:hypothetical protein